MTKRLKLVNLIQVMNLALKESQLVLVVKVHTLWLVMALKKKRRQRRWHFHFGEYPVTRTFGRYIRHLTWNSYEHFYKNIWFDFIRITLSWILFQQNIHFIYILRKSIESKVNHLDISWKIDKVYIMLLHKHKLHLLECKRNKIRLIHQLSICTLFDKTSILTSIYKRSYHVFF